MPALPQNPGSWFLVLCVFGCAFLSATGMAAIGRSVGMRDAVARCLATALGCVVCLGMLLPLRYATPALAPLPVVALWLLAAWRLAQRKLDTRTPLLWAGLCVAYALALCASLWVALPAISAADALRNLSLDDVQRITIQWTEGPEEPTTISDQTDLAQILEALVLTVPYQPEREDFTNGYRVTIHTRRGPISFVMYRGRQGRPETAVLRPALGGPGLHPPLGHYENQPLYWLLVTRYRFPAWFGSRTAEELPAPFGPEP